MTLGPYKRHVEINHPNSHYRAYRLVQDGVRNSKTERNKPSPYSRFEEASIKTGNPDLGGLHDAPNTVLAYEGQTWTGAAGRLRDQCINKCYERLLDGARESAQLGASIAERKQSVDMIANRALQIVQTIRKIRRGDLSMLKVRQGLKRRPLGKGQVKDLGALWLEYHFGWEPMIKDIYGAIDILQSPFPYEKPVVATATMSRTDFGSVVDRYGTDWTVVNVRQSVSVRMQGTYSAENPLLMTANQLGLTNPASVAWELVPFSFVVDWFTNVGQVLSYPTDFLGIKRENESTTSLYRGSLDETHHWIGPYSWAGYSRFDDRAIRMERVPVILGPRLAMKPFKGFSLTRGATAIALLVGFLK